MLLWNILVGSDFIVFNCISFDDERKTTVWLGSNVRFFHQLISCDLLFPVYFRSVGNRWRVLKQAIQVDKCYVPGCFVSCCFGFTY